MLKRAELECREYELLAPYAMKSRDTKGRRHKESEHEYRSVYQRDKDRIIHSTAFRRLEYKTQVFVNHEGDYYRTRLTHTLEVSQIARSIARALRLNEDLTEAIALAHDLGHTPFGHSGEDALQGLMKEHGGFDHNEQGLRVVDLLEDRYPDFPGLNLTWEVREGIIRHSTLYDKEHTLDGQRFDSKPTMEARIVNIADEIAYDNHDLDDGLTSGLINFEMLESVPLWREAKGAVKRDYPDINKKFQKYQIIRHLINMEITDAISQVERNEQDVSFSQEMLSARREMSAFLFKNLYQHYRVIRMADKARRFIEEIFNVYLAKPEQLPTTSRKKIEAGEDKFRVICDYMAGMTDRFALDEYKKLFEPYERV